MKHLPLPLILPFFLLWSGGCAFIPEARHRQVVHNPFPQLKRVAVLPFFNQSDQPTVNGEEVAQKYYAALQSVPGFEVLPVGVTKAQWVEFAMHYGEPQTGKDFQKFAQTLGVEAVIVGSVTDYEPYYPPRMAMTVHWYAANPGYHPIPPGYGLPWGTESEKQIPRRVVQEAEFELARSQLKTQTPIVDPSESYGENNAPQLPPASSPPGAEKIPAVSEPFTGGEKVTQTANLEAVESAAYQGDPMLPNDWPDPTDLIPDPPTPYRPVVTLNDRPVLSHTRLYRADDTYFTDRLSDYVETGDDARPGGWQDYLKRSDDFIHFCCYLHITEMLESRGGSDQSDLILRWPLSRY